MACQHLVFGSAANPISIPHEAGAVWFQPILDTFEHRILAHECFLPGDDGKGTSIEAAQLRSVTIYAAAREAKQGIYFLNLVPSSIDDPGLDMVSTIEAIFDCGMKPANVVFQVIESDLARDPVHSRRIREYLRRRGFGFALSNAGVGAGAYSLQAFSDFAPDFITLDKRLVHNVDQPCCAPTVSKLVQMAEKSGARVIAEGVDRVRMVENLWLLGVQFMQGHLFGEPSPHTM